MGVARGARTTTRTKRAAKVRGFPNHHTPPLRLPIPRLTIIFTLSGAKTFRDLSLLENKAGRTKEATAVASAADAAALDAVAATRSPLPKLRWLLAVELITSGAAFDLFGDAAGTYWPFTKSRTTVFPYKTDTFFYNHSRARDVFRNRNRNGTKAR